MESFEIKQFSDAGACDGEIYQKRRNKLRKLIQRKNIDALLVALPANRYYLSGFELHDGQCNESSGMLLIGADGNDWLATDSRYKLAAEKLWAQDRIFIYKGDPCGIEPLLAKAGTLIGIEANAVNWQFIQNLRNSSRSGFKPSLINCSNLVEELRIIKEPCEIAALEKSFKLNQSLMDWLGEQICSDSILNLTEKQLAWQIEKYFREHGAMELAFASIVANGVQGALPHATPQNELLKENSPLLVDIGCRVEDYCSDQTRTWWLGPSKSKFFEDAMKLVLDAQNAAFEMMKPGVRCSDVYLAANSVFQKANVQEHFTHGLGHGVGLETHEKPGLNPKSTQILQSGMVVTVEPGLYYPQWGGIRWEKTVLITEKDIHILGQ